MITPDLNLDGCTGHIIIEPNRPLSWQQNVRFIKVFALISFIIGAAFMYHGYLLVLPFSGLEVMFVAYCLYLVFRQYAICQVIYFTENSVIIESGEKQANERIEYQRYWSKFYIDHKDHYSIPRLTIRCNGKSTEIGSFLSLTDKLLLINLIKGLTARFQSQPRKE